MRFTSMASSEKVREGRLGEGDKGVGGYIICIGMDGGPVGIDNLCSVVIGTITFRVHPIEPPRHCAGGKWRRRSEKETVSHALYMCAPCASH